MRFFSARIFRSRMSWVHEVHVTRTLCEVEGPRVVFKDFKYGAKGAPFLGKKVFCVPVSYAFF